MAPAFVFSRMEADQIRVAYPREGLFKEHHALHVKLATVHRETVRPLLARKRLAGGREERVRCAESRRWRRFPRRILTSTRTTTTPEFIYYANLSVFVCFSCTDTSH